MKQRAEETGQAIYSQMQKVTWVESPVGLATGASPCPQGGLFSLANHHP